MGYEYHRGVDNLKGDCRMNVGNEFEYPTFIPTLNSGILHVEVYKKVKEYADLCEDYMCCTHDITRLEIKKKIDSISEELLKRYWIVRVED